MNLPIVTDTDRARGWAELEVEFLDGSRQFVRVHEIDKSEFLRLAKLSAGDALAECLAKSLRMDKQFIARMLPEYLCAAAATMALLLHGDATGEAIVSHAVHSVFQPQQKSASPEIAEMLALGKNLREQLALLPKFSECPRVSPELGQLLAKPV